MIIFDLDGTLIDSSLGIYSAYKDTCLKYNFNFVNLESFKRVIGPPFPKMFEILHPNVEVSILEKVSKTFSLLYGMQDYYSNYILRDKTQKFLQSLSLTYNLSIVTNKQTSIAKSIIKASNLLPYFDFIAGRDFFSKEHTKLDVFKQLLIMNKIPKSSTYIGDTRDDEELSSKLGVNFVGINSLFGHGISPQTFLPDYDSLRSLL